MMNKNEQQPETDIADEPYRGPGRVVVAAGEGFLAHYGLAFASGAAVAVVTALFHKPTARLLETLRNGARQMAETQGEGLLDSIKRGGGNIGRFLFGHGTGEFQYLREANIARTPQHRNMIEKTISSREHGFGYWLLDHTVGLVVPPLSKYVRTKGPRVQDSIAAGGLVGGLAFIFSPIYFAFSGVRNADAGRQQFERARQELVTSRAECDAVRDQYVKTRLELEDLKTVRAAEAGTLHVAKDQPSIRDEAAHGREQHEASTTSAAVEAHASATAQAAADGRKHRTTHEASKGWAQAVAAPETEQAPREAARA